ncbi:MAG: PQQ-binding-like beta-propeller repeat protein [Bacteroidota bacterium]
MNKSFVFIFVALLIDFISYSQSDFTTIKVENHIPGGGDEAYFKSDILYLPERKKNGNIFLRKFDCLTQKLTDIYYPPEKFKSAPGFVIDDEFIYFHITQGIAKVSLETNKIVWEAKYESNYAAQIAPFLHGKYVGIDLDDKIFVLDKITGDVAVDINEKDLSQSIGFTKDHLIYGKDDGKLIAFDIKKKSKSWKFDVGSDVGSGCLDLGGKVILPSGDVRIYCVDEKTGSKIWSIEKDELKASCGSGFNEVPTLFNNKLYVLQRESGLYEIDKNTGSILSVIKIDDLNDGQLIVYHNHFYIASTKGFFVYNPSDRSVKKIADLEVSNNLPSGIQFNGRFLALNYIGSYSTEPKVLLFDLEKLKRL